MLLAKCLRQCFFCCLQKVPHPLWTKKSPLTLFCLSHLQVIEFDDGSGSVLRIQPLRTPRDEAIYECVASNSVGETSATTRLTVLRGRSFSTTPKDKQTPHTPLTCPLFSLLTQVSLHLLVSCLSCPVAFVSHCRATQSDPIRDSGYTHVAYSNLIRFSPLAI